VMEVLHIKVMNGATVSQASLSSHVGIGSRGHCLAGDFLINAVTSSTVTGRKVDSGSVRNLLLMDGSGQVAVDCRMRSIFASSYAVSIYCSTLCCVEVFESSL